LIRQSVHQQSCRRAADRAEPGEGGQGVAGESAEGAGQGDVDGEAGRLRLLERQVEVVQGQDEAVGVEII